MRIHKTPYARKEVYAKMVHKKITPFRNKYNQLIINRKENMTGILSIQIQPIPNDKIKNFDKIEK